MKTEQAATADGEEITLITPVTPGDVTDLEGEDLDDDLAFGDISPRGEGFDFEDSPQDAPAVKGQAL